MTDTSKSLSIIAYYLSEFDMKAVHALGFATQKEAFKQISVRFNRDNNYLKLRRDEFDALPDSASHRNGWRNRPAAKDVISLAAYLKQFSFDELTKLVKALIDSQGDVPLTTVNDGIEADAQILSELDLENLINFVDPNATVRVKTSQTTVRVYNTSIIQQLKSLYKGNCQLCGCKPFRDLDIDLTEVHHIDYFATSHNNNSNNLVVLCPNHHRLIHKVNPVFDRNALSYVYPDGSIERVKMNYHL